VSYDVLEISLAQGVGEKVDPRLAPNGVLARAENVWQDKQGTWKKRRGFRVLSRTDALGYAFGYNVTPEGGSGLAVLQGEVLVFGSRRYSALVTHRTTQSDKLESGATMTERGYLVRGHAQRIDVTSSMAYDGTGAG
jgi:hypothetical protein